MTRREGRRKCCGERTQRDEVGGGWMTVTWLAGWLADQLWAAKNRLRLTTSKHTPTTRRDCMRGAGKGLGFVAGGQAQWVGLSHSAPLGQAIKRARADQTRRPARHRLGDDDHSAGKQMSQRSVCLSG